MFRGRLATSSLRSVLLLVVTLGSYVNYSRAQTAVVGTITGVVVDSATGSPLSDVVISGPRRFEGMSRLPTGAFADAPPQSGPQTRTDSQGRFLLPDLGPGRVAISFEKSNYVTYAANYAIKPGEVTDLGSIRVVASGVISGRVFRKNGDPAVGVEVSLYCRRLSNGQVQLVEVFGTMTDDRGEFRLSSLRPDRYWIGFRPKVTPGFRSVSVERWSTPEDPEHSGYVPLLYPGVGSLDAAELIEVNGNEVRLRDVVLGQERLGSIRVRFKVDKLPTDVDFELRAVTPTVSVDYSIEGGPVYRPPARIRLEGPDVVRQYWPTTIGVFEAIARFSSDGTIADRVARFDFLGQDTDVTLDLTPAQAHLDIRVVMEQDGKEVPLAGIRPSLVHLQSGANVPFGQIEATAADGKLRVGNLSAGLYGLRGFTYPAGQTALPVDTYVASSVQGDRNSLAVGIEVGIDVPELEIRIRKGLSRLRGKVVDDHGQSMSDALVSVVPDPPLDNSVLQSLRRTARTDQNGNFEMAGIIPGNYHAYARLTAGIPSLLLPNFLANSGQAISLGESEESVIELRLLTFP